MDNHAIFGDDCRLLGVAPRAKERDSMAEPKAADMTPKERMTIPRQDERFLDPQTRISTFDEVNLGFDEEAFSWEIFRDIKC